MAKKRRCRRTPGERDRHETAVKIRKMTDEQLCDFVDRTAPAFGVGQYLRHLDELAGTGNGIGAGTIAKLRKIAQEEGYIDDDD